jgi:trehalose 6-phosphate synthase
VQRRRFIVVSNRGPLVYERGPDGLRSARRGGGGLVTALASLCAHHEVTWVASALSEEDRAVWAEAVGGAIEERSRRGDRFRLRFVLHGESAYRAFYTVVANPMLWFIQHRLWDLARRPSLDEGFRAAWEQGYVAVNEAFARAVLAELEQDPRAIVFFHDYHLYLAPRLVRERAPEALLAHFVHVPWVGRGGWSVLPRDVRRDLHDGLLANDLVGFHTRRWQGSFLDSAVAVLGATRRGESLVYRGRRTATVACPISVDVAEFERLTSDAEVLARREEIRALRPERLVVRVDRTDPAKNILRGLRAFELLLQRRRRLRRRVTLLALLDPSRQEIPEYRDYLAEIVQTAEEINARLGEADWQPIQLRIEDDFPRSVAAYMEYDVLLVNPIFDGLNLVAKEGPLVNQRSGVLVLSENAGACEELAPWALPVNPFDIGEQAAALEQALSMPAAERRRRLQGLRDHVRRHDLEAWVASLLARLDRLGGKRRR